MAVVLDKSVGGVAPSDIHIVCFDLAVPDALQLDANIVIGNEIGGKDAPCGICGEILPGRLLCRPHDCPIDIAASSVRAVSFFLISFTLKTFLF